MILESDTWATLMFLLERPGSLHRGRFRSCSGPDSLLYSSLGEDTNADWKTPHHPTWGFAGRASPQVEQRIPVASVPLPGTRGDQKHAPALMLA